MILAAKLYNRLHWLVTRRVRIAVWNTDYERLDEWMRVHPRPLDEVIRAMRNPLYCQVYGLTR